MTQTPKDWQPQGWSPDNPVPPPLPPAHLRDPGDAWVYTASGTKYWGAFGAAGVLVWHRQHGVLLQHRAAWSHNGGTWGIPGGARRQGESAVEGALREAHEEAGVPADGVTVITELVVTMPVIDGEWNRALMAEAAAMIAEALPSLADPADPGRTLDYLPRRLDAADEPAAALVDAGVNLAHQPPRLQQRPDDALILRWLGF
jgi:8-oxo-dGTP pyrophosphatase MutT (NUDIX family)